MTETERASSPKYNTKCLDRQILVTAQTQTHVCRKCMKTRCISKRFTFISVTKLEIVLGNSKLFFSWLGTYCWSLFFLREVSSCPPFSGRLLSDKLWAFGKMLSSSRAHLRLWQPAAPAKGTSYLHDLLWVNNAQRWGNCFNLPHAGIFHPVPVFPFSLIRQREPRRYFHG